MEKLNRNLNNRKWLVERLRAEIIGPDPPVNASKIVQVNNEDFFTWQEFRKPKAQQNGEEILWQDSPVKRYGAGILFPYGVTEFRQIAAEADSSEISADAEEPLQDSAPDEILEKNVSDSPSKTKILADETENYDVTLANAYRPSAMGLSFLADFSVEKKGLSVEVNCARYRKTKVHVGESPDAVKKSERTVWLREPAKKDGTQIVEQFTTEEFLASRIPVRRWVQGWEEKLELDIISRRIKQDSNQRLLTISLVNRQTREMGDSLDEFCFFQTRFTISGQSGTVWILPYPEVIRLNRNDGDEEEIIRLLYRDRQTFAIGHGCAASWIEGRPDMVGRVWTECLPLYETPGISADLKDRENNPVRVSMRKLAGLDPSDDGTNEIQDLVSAYRGWINDLRDYSEQGVPVPEDLRGTADILIERCEQCLIRIEDGIRFLSGDNQKARWAKKAFQLANHAMLIAQLKSTRDIREPIWIDGMLSWSSPIDSTDPGISHATKGYWRAFQIAFLLMSLRGICDPLHADRNLVDLIWFPTGGGKTEAYLGLTAFTVFFNRLAGEHHAGANVIMRYTLRLLTAQQFQRAALLFCSMEVIRRKNSGILGEKPFRLGMWVGGSATPNKRSDALSKLKSLQNNPEEENPFVLLKCPWCASRFGIVESTEASSGTKGKKINKYKKIQHRTLGYHAYTLPGTTKQSVAFRCADKNCDFGYAPGVKENPPLPIFVVDEDIYEFPPDLIIGTVDKFAMLSWNPDIRSIFGINSNGDHDGLPPTLIIQDELHLISGPLGSMVGAYETAIEELCTRRENNIVIRPKIVASTATISRADDQVRALYARDRVMLFPPSGISAGDSFFAREDRNTDGTPKAGRLYAGVLAPGHGSLQTTEARVFATLLQWPVVMEVLDNNDSERDPWWTLLLFFNSLRELGGASTLLVADARDYLRVILDRHGIPYQNIRQLLNWIELTSRIREDNIPKAIQSLEKNVIRDKDGYLKDAVEVCLASNIIEVGVDIDRLGLMTIIGQPKTTSQYIQVSSRIGRSADAPGLVVVVYSQSKPRDRSHYERFRTYHQRLYAQVEPTSVTPYSPPAVERALHGVLLALARQKLPTANARIPRPFPLEPNALLREMIEQIFGDRVLTVDGQEKNNVIRNLQLRLSEWKAWDPAEYGGFGVPPESAPLMHPAGSQERPQWNGHSWAVLSSLRDVDATCEAEITSKYNEIQEDQPI